MEIQQGLKLEKIKSDSPMRFAWIESHQGWTWITNGYSVVMFPNNTTKTERVLLEDYEVKKKEYQVRKFNNEIPIEIPTAEEEEPKNNIFGVIKRTEPIASFDVDVDILNDAVQAFGRKRGNNQVHIEIVGNALYVYPTDRSSGDVEDNVMAMVMQRKNNYEEERPKLYTKLTETLNEVVNG